MSQTTTVQEEELIQFTLNNTLVSMKLEFVERINLQEKIIPIPRSPSQVVGVAKIENNIIPILSLEKFLNATSSSELESQHKVLIVTTIADATFALQTSSIPKVFRGTIASGKASSKFKFLPDNWVESIATDANNNELPVLNPNEFWLGLATGGVTGLGIKESDLDTSKTKPSGSKNGKSVEKSDVPEKEKDKNTTESNIEEKKEDLKVDTKDDKKETKDKDKTDTEEPPKKKKTKRGRKKKSDTADETDTDESDDDDNDLEE